GRGSADRLAGLDHRVRGQPRADQLRLHEGGRHRERRGGCARPRGRRRDHQRRGTGLDRDGDDGEGARADPHRGAAHAVARPGRPARRHRRGDLLPRVRPRCGHQRPDPARVRAAHGGQVSDERRVEELERLPRLGGLFVRGAAGSATKRPGGTVRLPEVAYRVAAVDTAGEAAHLAAYQELLGEPSSDVLSAGYLHVLAFPLATAVMVRPDFPLPLLGMVHLANAVELRGPVQLGDVLEVRAWAENLRPHRRGVQVDLVAEVRRADDPAGVPVWRGVSTYLAKGFEAPGPVPAGVTVPEDAAEDRAPVGTWAPPLPTGRWALGPGTGRAYGAVSGDRNPIHLSALSAKAFGFPRAIAHGMYTAARALA